MPGKRVRRIGVFRSASGIYCSFYVHQPPESGKLVEHYWCEVKPKQYEHMAESLNEAAREGNGSLEAHTALPGFVWERTQ